MLFNRMTEEEKEICAVLSQRPELCDLFKLLLSLNEEDQTAAVDKATAYFNSRLAAAEITEREIYCTLIERPELRDLFRLLLSLNEEDQTAAVETALAYFNSRVTTA